MTDILRRESDVDRFCQSASATVGVLTVMSIAVLLMDSTSNSRENKRFIHGPWYVGVALIHLFVALPLCVLCLSCIVPMKRAVDKEHLEWLDFCDRVGEGSGKLTNPDRVSRLWRKLSRQGRNSIHNQEDFLREEQYFL